MEETQAKQEAPAAVQQVDFSTLPIEEQVKLLHGGLTAMTENFNKLFSVVMSGVIGFANAGTQSGLLIQQPKPEAVPATETPEAVESGIKLVK